MKNSSILGMVQPGLEFHLPILRCLLNFLSVGEIIIIGSQSEECNFFVAFKRVVFKRVSVDSSTITLFSDILKGVRRKSLNVKKKGGIKTSTIKFITNNYDLDADKIANININR